MPLTLTELAASLCRGTVVCRGVPRPARAVSAAESARAMRLYPRPQPPPGPARDARGRPDLSLPPEPDESNPAYRQALEEWARYVKAVEVGIALEVEAPCGPYARGMSDADFAAWARAVAAHLAEAMSRDELNDLHRQVSDLHRAAEAEEAARKN